MEPNPKGLHMRWQARMKTTGTGGQHDSWAICRDNRSLEYYKNFWTQPSAFVNHFALFMDDKYLWEIFP